MQEIYERVRLLFNKLKHLTIPSPFCIKKLNSLDRVWVQYWKYLARFFRVFKNINSVVTTLCYKWFADSSETDFKSHSSTEPATTTILQHTAFPSQCQYSTKEQFSYSIFPQGCLTQHTSCCVGKGKCGVTVGFLVRVGPDMNKVTSSFCCLTGNTLVHYFI